MILVSTTTQDIAVHSLVDSDIPVAPLFYTGDVHNSILSGGVDPWDIVILSRYRKKKSALKGVQSLEVLMDAKLKESYGMLEDGVLSKAME